MDKIAIYKITRDTNLWKKNQKVWQIFGTGALAAYCIGRWRGKGRWIKCWIHVADKEGKGFKGKPNARFVGYVRPDGNLPIPIGQACL